MSTRHPQESAVSGDGRRAALLLNGRDAEAFGADALEHMERVEASARHRRNGGTVAHEHAEPLYM